MLAGNDSCKISHGTGWGKFASINNPYAGSVNASVQIAYAISDETSSYTSCGVFTFTMYGNRSNPIVQLYDVNYSGLSLNLFRATYNSTTGSIYLWSACPDTYENIFLKMVIAQSSSAAVMAIYNGTANVSDTAGSPVLNGENTYVNSLISPIVGGGGGVQKILSLWSTATTSFAVTNTTGSVNVSVTVTTVATGAIVMCDVVVNTSTVTCTMAVAPAANAYTITIIG